MKSVIVLIAVVVGSSGALPRAQTPLRIPVHILQHDTVDQGGTRVAYSLREKLQHSAIYTAAETSTAKYEIVLTSAEPCLGQSVIVAIFTGADHRYLGHSGYIINMARVADRGPDVAADSILAAFDKLLHPMSAE